jgi:hypothetical protein
MKTVHYLLRLSLVVGLILSTALPGLANPQSLPSPQEPSSTYEETAEQSKIEPSLLKELEATADHSDFFVWLAAKADLSPAYRLQTKEEKGRFVFETLRAHAERTQKDLRAFLDAQGASYKSFYISNKILVRGGSQKLIFDLAARPDVAHLTANHRYQLDEPRVNPKGAETILAVEPNISFVNADDVWALGFTGRGTVLAGNDTGLDWQHPAILNHYRGWNGVVADHNYNWWDASGTYPSAPADGFGHGTHTTGTMVGDDAPAGGGGGANQIGMAPGATTIHCKNMDDWGGGYDEWFIECFQWDLAPWDLSGAYPRPDLAPDAVNNSWGYGGGGYPTFEEEITALQAAGILVEVSAGNEGPDCGTLRSPGDYGEVLTTGSVSHASGVLPGSLTWFSSRGPSTLSPDYLPDVMAPGENIRSAVPGGGYQNWDGTSMAGPHVTGLVGLMWAANPGLRGLVPETQQILFTTGVPLTGQTGANCGGDYVVGPNHDWGYGTIDALAAVEAAVSFGGVGILAGTVTDSASDDPLPGVEVRASLTPDLTWQTLTDESGQYARAVFSGTYTVTAELYGYYPAEFTNVQVISGTTTTFDIAMDSAPSYQVSGQVTDATTGWPLYARIDIGGYPGGAVWTDPGSGQYSISLAAGVAYTFRVSAWVEGYQFALRTVGPLGGPQTEDFALMADPLACSAPGYQPEFVYFEDFETGDGGYTPEGYTSWTWGAPTSGPRSAHSGEYVWATNLSGDYWDNESGTLTSPDIDLSAHTGQTVIVAWWQWLQTEECCDFASVEVSNDGGASWMVVYGPASGQVNTSWVKYTAALDPSYAVSNFRVRFTLQTDFSITASGFYVDDVGVGVATPLPSLYAEDFESSNGGYAVDGVTSWDWGTPTRGPDGAHSGSNAWGTNLSGNYNNNEDGCLISPDIDLSAGAGGAESLELSWWQWLQTESGYDFASVQVSDGTSWTEIISVSGIQNIEWEQQRYYLDPVRYGVSDFQIGFCLRSDESVTYPGFHVDDVGVGAYSPIPPTLPCNAPPGGLVVGNVYDANTGIGLNGAAVTSSVDRAISQATPLDDAVDDGFYTLYADAGSQAITAAMTGGYGSDVQNPVVVAGDAIRQDFALIAGWLAAAPPALQATLDMGTSTALAFDLQNNGGLDASFELREKAGDFIPTLLGAVTVPGYQVPATSEGTVGTYAGQQPDQMVSRESWQYLPSSGAVFSSGTADVLLVAAADAVQIQAILQGYPDLPVVDLFDARMDTPALAQLLAYDAVVLISNNPFADPVAMGDVLADYVDGGGTVVQTVPTFYDPWGNGWSLQGRYMDEGYSPFVGVGDWFLWADLGDFDPAHPIMEGVISAGDYFRQIMELSPGAELVASWTDDEFVATKESVVALNTFLPDGYAWSGDVPLIVHNSIAWLMTGGDVPWLASQPVSGTVASLSAEAIMVTLDAGVAEIAQPGQYTAQLRIVDDTPYNAAAIPITMTVSAPADWGKLAGVVTGLGRCDTPEMPLATATVEIHGLATTQPDANGQYGYWMSQGTYTVTVSAPGYVPQVFAATIVAGQTTSQDAALHLDAPCTDPPAEALDVTVPQGGLATETLVMGNSGAGELSFTFLESSFDLASVIGPGGSPMPSSSFQLGAQTGPASILSLAGRASGSESEASPLSGWFGGVDLPGGIVRYAHAQCAEQPDSFYVFGGVDGSFGISSKAWRYDAAANTWTQLADVPSGSEAPVATCFGGKIYVLGGGGTDQFYIYDIVSDSWAAGAPLPRGVEGAVAAAWGGKVYLVGGDDDFAPSTGVSDQVDVYDITTDTWIGTGTPMSVASSNAGFVQVGPYLYVTGGWGVDAPLANLAATLRYDLEADAWQIGPEFASARADLALAATVQALYAIGGDKDGNSFFDASSTVERLDLSAWPSGAWGDLADPLPVALAANNAGFCTLALFDGQVAETWSVGGLDSYWYIGGRALFREAPGEKCYSIYADVPWLVVAPAAGAVAPGGSLPIVVTFDASALSPGSYTATLIVQTDDTGNYLMHIPVSLTVVSTRLYYLPVISKNSGS